MGFLLWVAPSRALRKNCLAQPSLPLSLLKLSQAIDVFSFSLSLSPVSNPITTLLSLIYSLRLVGESWLPLILLMWVGPKLIILDKEYASLGMVSRTLELVPASKRLLDSMISSGTLKLSRHFYPSHGYLPTILHVGGIHVPSLWIVSQSWHWAYAWQYLWFYFGLGPR